jgi:hypothetical protein
MKKLVISVCGGGALGVGPLKFMSLLEKDLGANLADVSEAFAGTSTGSIIASGLCSGMTAQELFDLYKGNLKTIFKEKTGALPPIARSNYYRYDNSGLKKLLYKYFPGKMDEFDKPIYIPTTYMNGESVEKVWDRSDDWMDRAYAILSSCSAPTYFDTLTLDGKIYCDGGMWANDPIMVLESGLKKLCANKKKYRDLFCDGVKILTFNTGMITPNKGPAKKNALGWLEYIMDDWIARTGNSNYFEACANIGEDNVYRVAPKVGKKYPMDDLSLVDEVAGIWENEYKKVKKEVLKFVKSTM